MDIKKREIRFRAWDEKKKIMKSGKSLKELCIRARDGGFKHWDDSVPIMQYTGLKDKNGKKIYEGDIIKFIWKAYLNNGVIRFNSKLARFDTVDYNGDIILNEVADYGEVIGNIYENSKLLEE